MAEGYKRRGRIPLDVSSLSFDEVAQKLQAKMKYNNDKSKRYYDRMKEDPEKYEQFMEKCKRNNIKYQQKLRDQRKALKNL